MARVPHLEMADVNRIKSNESCKQSDVSLGQLIPSQVSIFGKNLLNLGRNHYDCKHPELMIDITVVVLVDAPCKT